LNFRVIAKQVKNLEKILHSVSYAVLACYDNISNMWTYLKFKGPLFLVEDKLKQKKIVILNQCSTKDYIQPVTLSAISLGYGELPLLDEGSAGQWLHDQFRGSGLNHGVDCQGHLESG
jgi:hypothetical protein